MSLLAWEGTSLDTTGQLLDAASKAQRDGKAAEFLAAYRAAEPEYADANLGYLIGYLEPAERRAEMYEAYAVKHPIFGGAP